MNGQAHAAHKRAALHDTALQTDPELFSPQPPTLLLHYLAAQVGHSDVGLCHRTRRSTAVRPVSHLPFVMRQPAQSQCELNPWGAPNGIALASTYREDRLGDCIAGCRRPASRGRQRRRQWPQGKGSSPRVGRAACQEAPQEIHSVASPSPAADTGCLPRTPRAWLEFVPHCTGRGRIGFFFLELFVEFWMPIILEDMVFSPPPHSLQ